MDPNRGMYTIVAGILRPLLTLLLAGGGGGGVHSAALERAT